MLHVAMQPPHPRAALRRPALLPRALAPPAPTPSLHPHACPQAKALARSALLCADSESVRAEALVTLARAHHALGELADAYRHYDQVGGGRCAPCRWGAADVRTPNARSAKGAPQPA